MLMQWLTLSKQEKMLLRHLQKQLAMLSEIWVNSSFKSFSLRNDLKNLKRIFVNHTSKAEVQKMLLNVRIISLADLLETKSQI